MYQVKVEIEYEDEDGNVEIRTAVAEVESAKIAERAQALVDEEGYSLKDAVAMAREEER